MLSLKTNASIIQDVYAAFRQGDIPLVLSFLAQDVQWVSEGPSAIPYSGSFTGAQDVLRFFQAIGTVDQPKLEIEIMLEQADAVAAYGRWKGTVRATGKSFDVPIGHFFTLRDAKITRFIDLQDTAALALAHS